MFARSPPTQSWKRNSLHFVTASDIRLLVTRIIRGDAIAFTLIWITWVRKKNTHTFMQLVIARWGWECSECGAQWFWLCYLCFFPSRNAGTQINARSPKFFRSSPPFFCQSCNVFDTRRNMRRIWIIERIQIEPYDCLSISNNWHFWPVCLFNR